MWVQCVGVIRRCERFSGLLRSIAGEVIGVMQPMRTPTCHHTIGKTTSPEYVPVLLDLSSDAEQINTHSSSLDR